MAKNAHKSEDSDVIGLEKAIKMLNTSKPTFYRWLHSGKVKGMKVGRQWRFYRADIEAFMKGETPRFDVVGASPKDLIESLTAKAKEQGVKLEPMEALSFEYAVKQMIRMAIYESASDIHISAHLAQGKPDAVGALRFRINGTLRPIVEFDTRLLPAVIDQWKSMANCDVVKKSKPQDGRILIEVAGRKGDIRVSFMPTVYGEAVTAKILDRSPATLDLKSIPMGEAERERIQRAIKLPWGLILFTGPTGCGKTTMAYSCIHEVAGPGLKAVTVEHPVEYHLPWVTQTQINPQDGFTYAAAMRSVLRNDPDVIFIGELRDADTAQMATQATISGHLVMSTLHTNDSFGAVQRLLDVKVSPFVLADALKLVVAQRLVRKLCPHCAVSKNMDPSLEETARKFLETSGTSWADLANRFKSPVGCEKCGRSGYAGRTLMTEVLLVNDELAGAIRNGASTDVLKKLAVDNGMVTLAGNGIRLAAEGITSLNEVLRYLVNI